MDTRTITVNGIRTRLREAGDPTATEAVVFVHGNPGPLEDFDGLLRGVAPFSRALAWDLPGFGEADKPADFDHTAQGHAAFLGEVIEALGLTRVHLVLHDIGLWGLEWAARHPDRVGSVVLLGGEYLDHWLAKIWRTPVLGRLWFAGLSRLTARVTLGRTDPKLSIAQRDAIYRAYRAPETRRAVLAMYRRTDQPALATWLDEVRRTLAPFDLPALIVVSSGDTYVPRRYAEENRAAFPSAETVLVDGGHWMMHDAANEVEAAVSSFLREQCNARSTIADR